VVNNRYKTQKKVSDIRLWLCEDKLEDVTNSIQKVSEALKANTPMSDQKKSQATDEDQNEENSGIECQGKSLEPLMGTTMTIEDK
jgi:hypothetical protein